MCCAWVSRVFCSTCFGADFLRLKKTKTLTRVDALSGERARVVPEDLRVVPIRPIIEPAVAETDPKFDHANASCERLKKHHLVMLQLNNMDNHLRDVNKDLLERTWQANALHSLRKFKSAQRDIARVRIALVNRAIQRRNELARQEEESRPSKNSNEDEGGEEDDEVSYHDFLRFHQASPENSCEESLNIPEEEISAEKIETVSEEAADDFSGVSVSGSPRVSGESNNEVPEDGHIGPMPTTQPSVPGRRSHSNFLNDALRFQLRRMNSLDRMRRFGGLNNGNTMALLHQSRLRQPAKRLSIWHPLTWVAHLAANRRRQRQRL